MKIESSSAALEISVKKPTTIGQCGLVWAKMRRMVCPLNWVLNSSSSNSCGFDTAQLLLQFAFDTRLGGVDAAVDAVLGQQRVMGSGLHDVSFVED